MCKYCITDKDGYTTVIPLQARPSSKIHLHVNDTTLHYIGYGNRNTFNINFCPMCGRQLRKGVING